MPVKPENVRIELLDWFSNNKRSLPWRDTKDAYKIWLSEIILQQTRVAQGLPYYLRFTEKFPTVFTLAEASEQEVLKLWQGLGYYSRARNLHHAAKTVATIYNGIFPEQFEEIIKLKGIGNYTASAILSIVYNKPHAVLDGNVYRVLSRLYANALPINAKGAEKVYSTLAEELLDKKNPGLFNEAMMELGAMICTPSSPNCPECPLIKECEAFRMGIVAELPIKIKAKKAVDRDINYLFIHNSKGLYLKKRLAGDIWQGLYDMPEKESTTKIKEEGNIVSEPQIEYGQIPPLLKKEKHQLSHQTLHISYYDLQDSVDIKKFNNESIFVVFNKLNEFPLPKPIEKFLKEFLNKPKNS